jgi:hypothetical protein
MVLVSEINSFRIYFLKTQYLGWVYSSAVEHLSSMCEGLGWTSGTPSKKNPQINSNKTA